MLTYISPADYLCPLVMKSVILRTERGNRLPRKTRWEKQANFRASKRQAKDEGRKNGKDPNVVPVAAPFRADTLECLLPPPP